jgi:peptide chain release factor 3
MPAMTALTEKLLLSAAPSAWPARLRARGEQRRTRSDGCRSSASAAFRFPRPVMRFERDGLVFNLLDTPATRTFSKTPTGR